MEDCEIMGKLILELEHSEARDLLLRPNSYCNFDLPAYFNMQNLLDCADNIVKKEIIEIAARKVQVLLRV